MVDNDKETGTNYSFLHTHMPGIVLNAVDRTFLKTFLQETYSLMKEINKARNIFYCVEICRSCT